MRPYLFFGPRGVVCRLTDVFLIDATTRKGVRTAFVDRIRRAPLGA